MNSRAATAATASCEQVLVDIVDYVYHTELSSPNALRIARIAFLDALGCAFEALATQPDCVALLGPVVTGTKVPNGFRLPGTDFEEDPIKGAFDMGMLIRFCDHNDGFTGLEWGHPSDNLGALLAVADYMSRAAPPHPSPPRFPLTVSTLVTLQTKAYEIQGVLQLTNCLNARALDHVLLVKVASTAVISPLLGLSPPQCLAVLSHVFLDGAPLRAYRHAPNTIPRKGWAGGDACARAVQLALLARAGQAGAPSVLSQARWGFEDALLGGEKLTRGRPFGTYVMENVFFKLVPVEGHALAAQEASLEVRRRCDEIMHGGFKAANVKKVQLRTHQGACLIIDKRGPLRNAADRDHCLQYIVAVTILKGAEIEYRDYEDGGVWATDERVERLRECIEVVEDEAFSRAYLDPEKRSMASGVTVELQSGEVVGEVVVEYPLGNPKNPGTEEAVKKKYMRHLALGLEKEVIKKVTTAVWEQDDMPVCEFIDLLWRGHDNNDR